MKSTMPAVVAVDGGRTAPQTTHAMTRATSTLAAAMLPLVRRRECSCRAVSSALRCSRASRRSSFFPNGLSTELLDRPASTMSTRSSTSSKSTASLSCEALQVDLVDPVDMVDLLDALADGNSLPETPPRINGGGKPARSLELRGHGSAQPHFPLPLGEG